VPRSLEDKGDRLMTVDEFEKSTEDELRREANVLLGQAAQAGPLDRPGYFLQAQVYLDEIRRRHDDRIATRDLKLELVIIALICVEIAIGGFEIWQGVQDARDSRQQAAVMSNLQDSSATTAKTLEALQRTSEAMGDAIQKQLALASTVHLGVAFDLANARIVLTNTSSNDVAVWGNLVGKSRSVRTAPLWIAPSSPVDLPAKDVTDLFMPMMMKDLPDRVVVYEIYCRNRDGVPFVVAGEIRGRIEKERGLTMSTVMLSTVQRDWSR
jgi:hypothetical protein